jgi:hypothetical protein
MMPMRMRRKGCEMEKVENLYRTARAQHVLATATGSRNREFVRQPIQAFAKAPSQPALTKACGTIDG